MKDRLESMHENELYHYGVKGMKWGVRRHHKVNPDEQNKPKKKKSTTTKIAIGVGITAVVVAGAHFTKKYLDMNGDKTIPKGTDIQRMSRKVDELLDRPFYASHLKSDNRAYAKNNLFGTNWAYKKTLRSDSNIKIAGTKASIDTFSDWVKTDPAARERFRDIDFSKKSSVRVAYDKFNQNFVSPDIHDRALRDSYLRKLSERGYDAVRDRNDQLYSKKRSPILVFGKFGDITVKEVMEANKSN